MVAVLGAFVDPDQTPEFADRYGTNPSAGQFVAAAYLNVLNRAPDQDGLDYLSIGSEWGPWIGAQTGPLRRA